MFFEDPNQRRQLSKWIIRIITSSILIYLGVRHIDKLAYAISWLTHLLKPLLIGGILSLILNVPMSAIETLLIRKTKMNRVRRPVAIALTLVFILGLFIGIAFLVIPELVHAVTLIAQIAVDSLDLMAQMEGNLDFSQIPMGQYLSMIDIDWSNLKFQLEHWISDQNGVIVNQVMVVIRSLASNVVGICIGLVFSVYILAQKEKLKEQACRLIRAWLPRSFGDTLLHVADICNQTFRLFITGQATEAVILGTLCMIGMSILRIPYAPMIGALIGVTALIPIVGAWVGTIVGIIMILTVDPLKAVIFVAFLLILQQVEGNLIYPRVVGSKIKLPAMWVLAAVTVGGNLAGPLGMLLGVPAASAAYALLWEATEKREKTRKG